MAAVSGGEMSGRGATARRLLVVGAFAVLAAVVVNVLIRTVAVSVLGIGQGFPPLAVGPTVLFTAVGVLGAVGVFALISRLSRRPVRTFRRVALAVLLVSLVPDALLLFASPIPNTTVAGVVTLMVEHVAAYTVAVTTLTRAFPEGWGAGRGSP